MRLAPVAAVFLFCGSIAAPAMAAVAPAAIGAQSLPPLDGPTPVVPTGTVPDRIIDAASIKLTGQNWGYAYGPSIVQVPTSGNGLRYHLFTCSTGTELRTVDRIRHVWSDDGINWSSPVVKVSATGGPGTDDFSACDPSVVNFGGYWYLFYSGLRTVPNSSCPGRVAYQTVIRVARSTTIDGTYQKPVKKGSKVSWVSAAAETPSNDPLVLVAPRHLRCGFYGAGQQTVIVKDNQLWMWYLDDTANPDGTPAATQNLQIYLNRSVDPLAWNPATAELTQGAFVALDVKYDGRAQAFIQVAVPWVATSGPYGGLSAVPSKYSADGITWEWGRDLVAPEGMPRWSRVEAGISGDAHGWVSPGRTLIAFGCPHGSCLQFGFSGPAAQPAYGWWDLYGFQTDNLSASLFGS